MQGNSGRGKKTEDIAPPVLFGKDGKKHLTFEKFAKFINQLHDEIAMMEFARFDVAHKGEITMRDFAMLAVSQARPSDLSDFISRAEELRGRNDRIKFKEYQSFLRFVRCIDDVEIAIRSFHDSTGKLTRSDLKRVARAVTKTDLSDTIIEAIFYVFDSDRSETLEPEEFVDVLRERNTFGQTRKRDIGVVSALKCCKECIQENILS